MEEELIIENQDPEESMIVDRVWDEMHKVKGFLFQIDFYTNRKRRLNRRITYLTIISAFICAFLALFNNCELSKWIVFSLSLFVAITTTVKEFLPNFIQAEEELKEIDKIYDFYKEYLQKLEKLFRERYYLNTDVDDIKMESRFNSIVKTDVDMESRLNRLCRDLTDDERINIRKKTIDYFNRNFLNNNINNQRV